MPIQIQIIGSNAIFNGKLVKNCNRFQVSLEDTGNDNNSVDVLKDNIARTTGLENKQFEVIYAGSILCSSHSLEYYGIKDKSKVYVVPKVTSIEELSKYHIEEGTKSELIHLTRSIENVLRDRHTRGSLVTMYKTIVTNILEAMPVLVTDPVAVGLIHDPQLMHMYGKKRETCERLASLHPLILPAAALVATHIDIELLNRKEERRRRRGQQQQQQDGASTTSGGGSYSLDALSDSDDPMEDGEPVAGAGVGRRGAPGGPGGAPPLFAGITGSAGQITPQLLASALAQARSQPPTPASAPSSSSSTPQSFGAAAGTGGSSSVESSGGTPITSDMFRSAMASALATTPLSFDSQLQRLRDMGITDEDLARRALVAANGDVTAALELIFEDGGGQL